MSYNINKRYLTQQELEDIIAHLSESDNFVNSDEYTEDEDATDLLENIIVDDPFDLESMEIELAVSIILEPTDTGWTIVEGVDKGEDSVQNHSKTLKEKYGKKKNLVLSEDSLFCLWRYVA